MAVVARLVELADDGAGRQPAVRHDAKPGGKPVRRRKRGERDVPGRLERAARRRPRVVCAADRARGLDLGRSDARPGHQPLHAIRAAFAARQDRPVFGIHPGHVALDAHADGHRRASLRRADALCGVQ